MIVRNDRQHNLVELMKEQLYSAVIADCLDRLGAREQAMRHDIRPVFAESSVCGTAFTVLSQDVYESVEDPYALEIEALDALHPGDVVVWSTGDSFRTGVWGELLSTACVARGATGAVVDGLARDVRRIITMGFPLFCRGIKPVDSAGRSLVVDYQTSVTAGDVRVNPGDYVFGDFDGIVVIPAKLLEPCVQLAVEKVTKENQSRRELREGKLLREVYAKYGVL